MGKGYKHLSLQEREKIAVWKGQGLSLREMAAKLGRDHSTLSREINRNRGFRGYWPNKAQERALGREETSHKRKRLKSPLVRLEAERMLKKGWSPELIAGRVGVEHPSWPSISHEAIYQWIYTERRDLIGHLLHAHPKRRRRWKSSARKTRIPERVSIEERPMNVNRRQEPGHWETDLLVGSGASALQVSVERFSRYSKLGKLPNKTAQESRRALGSMLRPLPCALRRSVTYDNGSENSEHHLLNADLKMRSWFCRPYHSWEKGQVENTNGLIRRFIPKRSNLDEIEPSQVARIEAWLNHRPRKVLNFKTPSEVFNSFTGALAP